MRDLFICISPLCQRLPVEFCPSTVTKTQCLSSCVVGFHFCFHSSSWWDTESKDSPRTGPRLFHGGLQIPTFDGSPIPLQQLYQLNTETTLKPKNCVQALLIYNTINSQRHIFWVVYKRNWKIKRFISVVIFKCFLNHVYIIMRYVEHISKTWTSVLYPTWCQNQVESIYLNF